MVEKRVKKAVAALKGNPSMVRPVKTVCPKCSDVYIAGEDRHCATCGFKGKRTTPTRAKNNPSWEVSQGKAKAYVYETSKGRHTAEVVQPDGSREEHAFSGPGAFNAARSWARLRLFEVANPGKFKLYPLSKKPKGKRNPESTSGMMYETFHGSPSTEVLEYAEEIHRHSWLWSLGPLISMRVLNVKGNREATLEFPEPQGSKPGEVVMLTAEESGTQLFATGGDQKIPVKGLMDGFGLTDLDVRDNMLIGTIHEVTYRTKKKFEKDGQEEIDFYHVLGKEGSGGVLPVLIYHPRDSRIEIAGGRYYVGKPEEALGGVSPGIIG